jgi:hypothetical protein
MENRQTNTDAMPRTNTKSINNSTHTAAKTLFSLYTQDEIKATETEDSGSQTSEHRPEQRQWRHSSFHENQTKKHVRYKHRTALKERLPQQRRTRQSHRRQGHMYQRGPRTHHQQARHQRLSDTRKHRYNPIHLGRRQQHIEERNTRPSTNIKNNHRLANHHTNRATNRANHHTNRANLSHKRYHHEGKLVQENGIVHQLGTYQHRSNQELGRGHRIAIEPGNKPPTVTAHIHRIYTAAYQRNHLRNNWLHINKIIYTITGYLEKIIYTITCYIEDTQ